MRVLTFIVMLAALAATLAEALPWAQRHPLMLVTLLAGLVFLVGRHRTRGRRAPSGDASCLHTGCDGTGDGCNDGTGGDGDGGC